MDRHPPHDHQHQHQHHHHSPAPPSPSASSRASPYTRAMMGRHASPPDDFDDDASAAQAQAQARWTITRELSGESPSEAPTPAPTDAFEGGQSITREGTPSGGDATPALGSSRDRAAAPAASSSSSSSSNVDTDDADVRIAIEALGAMRHLDGKAASASRMSSVERRDRDDSTTSMTGNSSAISTSSVTSTAISSPSSTPATELTQASIGTGYGSSLTSSQLDACARGRTGRRPSYSGAAAKTLADLPSDFDFPAVVQDEDGNEVEVDKEMLRDADFLKRVSHLPLVRGTLRAYEMGKQRSKLVKYGGDLVESGVKAISRPVVGRLGASLGDKGKEQLDDFACRQLDRLYPEGPTSTTKEERQRIMQELDERERTEWAHMDEEERTKRRRAYWALHMEEKEREAVVNELRRRKGKSKEDLASPIGTLGRGTMSVPGGFGGGDEDEEAATSASSTALASGSRAAATTSSTTRDSAAPSSSMSAEQMQTALVQNVKSGGASRWGSMLVEAGATAGGLSAAMSEESMKSLKYCLQWLHYATTHIEHHITILRDLIVKLNHGELELTSPAAQNLGQIKSDVITTIRSVVDVVGKYAGGALPEPARNSVKAFILSLPARWATVNRAPAVASSNFGGSPSSPSFSPAHLSGGAHMSPSSSSSSSARSRSGSQTASHHAANAGPSMSAAATAQAANRVLTLAVESLDMLRSVTVVVNESLDRADLWVERLRMLGLQRKRQHENDVDPSAAAIAGGSARLEAPPQHWESARGLAHHRRGSIGGGSDLSMGTSASTKRRRTRGSATGDAARQQQYASAYHSPHLQSERLPQQHQQRQQHQHHPYASAQSMGDDSTSRPTPMRTSSHLDSAPANGTAAVSSGVSVGPGAPLSSRAVRR